MLLLILMLSYYIVIWGGTGKTKMMRLERAQRSILKVMLHEPSLFPTAEFYKSKYSLRQKTVYT